MEENPVEVRKQMYRNKYAVLKDNQNLRALVEAMDKVRKVKDHLEEELKEVNAEFDVLRIELVPTVMEDTGTEKVSYEGIGRVSLTGDLWVHTQSKEGLFNFFRKNKLKDLITEQISSSTLKAWVKDRIKSGKPLPPGEVLKVEAYTRASITKG